MMQVVRCYARDEEAEMAALLRLLSCSDTGQLVTHEGPTGGSDGSETGALPFATGQVLRPGTGRAMPTDLTVGMSQGTSRPRQLR